MKMFRTYHSHIMKKPLIAVLLKFRYYLMMKTSLATHEYNLVSKRCVIIGRYKTFRGNALSGVTIWRLALICSQLQPTYNIWNKKWQSRVSYRNQSKTNKNCAFEID